ncbi:expansin EXLX1 family cellulose-binding protein [Micromonospora sp. WMMA1923]|uniref:expansin EXLX1 family cellulose-binding protein n=1 Tax=Micromonospora sp. WMMA1923 TaxID=3404125 RepID=UPI003B95A4F5
MTDPSAHTQPDQPTGPGRRRARRPGPGRWLLAVPVVGVATVLGLTLLLRAGTTPACAAVVPARAGAVALAPGAAPAAVALAPGLAAPPVGGAVRQGKATFYDVKGGGGNCSFVAPPTNKRYVALGPSEYADAAACGGYLDVTGPKGSVRVVVMDQCPECAAGHIDLSAEAFAEIADPVQGIVPVSYRAVVNPPLPGPLTFRLKEGSSQYWFAVTVGSHGNPLRSVEVRQGSSGAWRPAARQNYNYWLIDSGAGPGPYSIRVTDVYDNRAIATGIRMLPEQVQRSDVRMYGGSAAAPRTARSATPSATPSRSAPPSPSATPTPSPSVSPPGSPTASPSPTATEAGETDAGGAAAGTGESGPAGCRD